MFLETPYKLKIHSQYLLSLYYHINYQKIPTHRFFNKYTILSFTVIIFEFFLFLSITHIQALF